jgi:hypothetical protein
MSVLDKLDPGDLRDILRGLGERVTLRGRSGEVRVSRGDVRLELLKQRGEWMAQRFRASPGGYDRIDVEPHVRVRSADEILAVLGGVS